jgi:hypothetical protein
MKSIRVDDNFVEDAKGRSTEHGLLDGRRARGSVKRTARCRAAARSSADKVETEPAPRTRVAARIDVGFGNALFIRGQGAGLSWDRGLPLQCVESAIWIWTAQNCEEPVTFKLLINDQLWSRGENLRADPGTQAHVVPEF